MVNTTKNARRIDITIEIVITTVDGNAFKVACPVIPYNETWIWHCPEPEIAVIYPLLSAFATAMYAFLTFHVTNVLLVTSSCDPSL